MYASFKYGEFEGERNGRYFTDLDEGRLAAVMQRRHVRLASRHTDKAMRWMQRRARWWDRRGD